MIWGLSSIRKKIVDWQNWPAPIFYIYPVLYYLQLAIKARSLFFYTAINPQWYNSGMKGDSKWNLYQYLNRCIVPRTILVCKNEALPDLPDSSFPMVAKPDVGQRGIGVSLVQDEASLKHYADKHRKNFILQSFSPLPEEWGILYVRYPNQHIGRITSLMKREFWQVIGNGKNTLWELVSACPIWPLQYHRFKGNKADWQSHIPMDGEKVMIEPIGNHNRGTEFLDKNALISSKLVYRVEQLVQHIPNFHFGRLDIKINSLEDFLNGGQVHVIEINGFGADPAHIYHKGYPLCDAYRDMLYHIKLGYLIATENKKLGHHYPSFIQGLKYFFSYEKPSLGTKKTGP
jgi:hypothetical protein